MKVGVRNEDKSRWERRVPLVPADLIALRDAGIDAAVQTSPHRAFGDDEFVRAGVPVQPDLSDCKIIIGIKEIPDVKFENGVPMLGDRKLASVHYNGINKKFIPKSVV